MDPIFRVYRKNAAGKSSYMDPGVLQVMNCLGLCATLDIAGDDPTPFVEQALTVKYGAPTRVTTAVEYVWVLVDGMWQYVCINRNGFEVGVDAGEPVVVEIHVNMPTS